MKNNSEFKRKLVIKTSQINDECHRNQVEFEGFPKAIIPKTMLYKNETRIVKKTLRAATAAAAKPLMMTTLSHETSTPLSLTESAESTSSLSLSKKPLKTSLKVQTTTSSKKKNNLTTRQTSEETNKLKEIQRDPLQQTHHQQQQQLHLQINEFKCHLQNKSNNNNNDDNNKNTTTTIHLPLPIQQHQQQPTATSVNSTICNDFKTGNTLLSYVDNKNNSNNRCHQHNEVAYKDENADVNVISLRALTSAAKTSCSSITHNNNKNNNKDDVKVKEDLIITSNLVAAASLTPTLIHHQQSQRVTTANSHKITTTINTTFKYSSLYYEMDLDLSSLKFWRNSNSTTSSCCSWLSPKSSSNVIWLLALVSMFSLFGCGHAGFACLSNPCVFGVCIDGLNR